jgi:hypothetical protein
MFRSSAEREDPLIFVDGRQSQAAAELQRGVCRTFRALGHSVMTELPLPNGRRTDDKWHEYLDYCDRLYFAVAADFPCEVIPEDAGLILADRYGAELVREPIEARLNATRRKAMMLCFAHAAALRLQHHLDPSCGLES